MCTDVYHIIFIQEILASTGLYLFKRTCDIEINYQARDTILVVSS